MQISIKKSKIEAIKADFEAIFIVKKDLKHKFIRPEDKKEFGFYKFEGDGVLVLPHKKRVYVGIKGLCAEQLRLGAAKVFNALKGLNVKSVKLASYIGECHKNSFSAIAEGFILGSYKYDKYISEKKSVSLNSVIIATGEEYSGKTPNIEHAELGIKHATAISVATNWAKEIVNEIPQNYTPLSFEKDAKNLAKSSKNISVKVLDEKDLQSENMGAFLAVNRASIHPPRLIHLKYTPSKTPLMRVVYVGKGLTYDSGGLSLKPADYMVTMKADKSGAAAAMAIIKAASELDLPFEIHSVLGATENMIGGDAYKPDDILVSRSGKTIEVRNTDAEGRLVLADCLDWAQTELKPDLLIDMATLTGACVVGLGEYTSGVIGNNYELQNEFKQFAQKSGEYLTILEFNDHLRELIKTKIADVCNVSSARYGGAITAGLFLDTFIRDEYKDRWLHLDIAGPAYVEKEWGYNAFGATGAGVRANLYYLLKLARKYELKEPCVGLVGLNSVATKKPSKKS